ncbi:hypothetical protein PF003_g19007 [Phytophthora fragariae]|nr:hypothetical protein PF003_g19007 [Phytophthora fragariae]
MRGHSKVVAGGQFRAASATSAKVPTAPSLACTKCMNARAKAVKAHHENAQAQTAAAELQKHVHRVEAAQSRLWEERSSHLAEIAQLRDKLTEKSEECVLIEEECIKLDKQVKMLQPESEETGIAVDEGVQCTLQQSADEVIKADQLREITAFKAEVQLLTEKLTERDQEIRRVSKDLEEAQTVAKLMKEERERETRAWLADSSEHSRRILELEEALTSSRKSLQDHQTAHQKECKLFEQVSQKLLADVKSKEKALEILEQKHKDDAFAQEQKHETLIHALKVRIAQKVADVDRLRAMVSELHAEKVAKRTLMKQLEAYEMQIETLMKENSDLVAKSLDQQQQTKQLSQGDLDKLSKQEAEELNRISEALKTAEQDNQTLQTRVAEVESDLAEQVSLLQRQKQSHARAMERLVESSLRLCVVAPTVNVQLNTNGAQLARRGGILSTEKTNAADKEPTELVSIMCRSSPQQDNIKRVIENQVLPLFTSVFLQGDDNTSPQADIPMTRWLQELLQDMQTRIAAQLESIYSTAVNS